MSGVMRYVDIESAVKAFVNAYKASPDDQPGEPLAGAFWLQFGNPPRPGSKEAWQLTLAITKAFKTDSQCFVPKNVEFDDDGVVRIVR